VMWNEEQNESVSVSGWIQQGPRDDERKAIKSFIAIIKCARGEMKSFTKQNPEEGRRGI